MFHLCKVKLDTIDFDHGCTENTTKLKGEKMTRTVTLLLLFLAGCSTGTIKQEELVDPQTSLPKWVYSPQEFCDESDLLCASGEGKSAQMAQAQALKSLASIFAVNIKSKVASYQSSSSYGESFNDAVEEAFVSVNASVSEILEAVQITEKVRKDGFSYALAALDISKASYNIRTKIRNIDDELSTLWKTQQRAYLKKILKLYFEREGLNDKYVILVDSRVPPPVELSQIHSWGKEDVDQGEVALVGKGPKWLIDHLKQTLSLIGFSLKKEASRKVKVSWKAKDEFINVKGFEKFSFLLTLEHIENEVKEGVFSSVYQSVCREISDCELKLKDKVIDDISFEIAALKLEK